MFPTITQDNRRTTFRNNIQHILNNLAITGGVNCQCLAKIGIGD